MFIEAILCHLSPMNSRFHHLQNSENNQLSFLSLMNLSIVTLFNEKAEPAELGTSLLGVRRSKKRRRFGVRELGFCELNH